VKSAVASGDLLGPRRCDGKRSSARAHWRRSRRRSSPVAAARENLEGELGENLDTHFPRPVVELSRCTRPPQPGPARDFRGWQVPRHPGVLRHARPQPKNHRVVFCDRSYGQPTGQFPARHPCRHDHRFRCTENLDTHFSRIEPGSRLVLTHEGVSAIGWAGRSKAQHAPPARR